MKDILRKLQVKDRSRVLILNLPEELSSIKEAFPGPIKEEVEGSSDLIMVFSTEMEEAVDLISRSIPTLEEDQLFWFCYPKKSSKRYSSSIDRDKTWELADRFGYRPVRQISLDDDWSAIRFRKSEYVKTNS
jgi:hypothetical protein